MTPSAQKARRIVRLFVILKGLVGFAQLSGDFQSVLAKDGGNEPLSLSNRFQRPSEMLRLQYRVQVMLTHYMFGLLSLLKCSEGKKGRAHWKTWGRAQKQRRDEGKKIKKSERKRIWQYHTPNFCHLLQRVWGDIPVGLTVWRGCSTRGQSWKDTSSVHTHFTNSARMRSGLGRALSASAWPEPSCLGLRSSVFDGSLVISPTGDVNEKIFLAR